MTTFAATAKTADLILSIIRANAHLAGRFEDAIASQRAANWWLARATELDEEAAKVDASHTAETCNGVYRDNMRDIQRVLLGVLKAPEAEVHAALVQVATEAL